MMRVREAMQTPVITIAAEAPLQQALALLERHRIGHLPVLKEQHVVGVLPRRTLCSAVYALASTRPPREPLARVDSLLVSKVMQRRVVTLPPDASAHEAARLVREGGIA